MISSASPICQLNTNSRPSPIHSVQLNDISDGATFAKNLRSVDISVIAREVSWPDSIPSCTPTDKTCRRAKSFARRSTSIRLAGRPTIQRRVQAVVVLMAASAATTSSGGQIAPKSRWATGPSTIRAVSTGSRMSHSIPRPDSAAPPNRAYWYHRSSGHNRNNEPRGESGDGGCTATTDKTPPSSSPDWFSTPARQVIRAGYDPPGCQQSSIQPTDFYPPRDPATTSRAASRPHRGFSGFTNATHGPRTGAAGTV